MNVLRNIIFFFLLLIGVLLIASALLPSSYKVERSIEISAPVEIIFNQVNDFSQMDNWSPWKEYDPEMQKTITGVKGNAGYKMEWKSPHEKVGNGSLTRVSTNENRSIVNTLKLSDFGMTSNDNWTFEPIQNTVKVTWFNTGELPIVWRIPARLMDLEGVMAPDFEKGLQKLKSFCESMPAANALIDNVNHDADPAVK